MSGRFPLLELSSEPACGSFLVAPEMQDPLLGLSTTPVPFAALEKAHLA
jgi:hypothetical protein